MAKGIFRQKALDRLASPEKLDELMVVTGPKGWWWLGTLTVLVTSILIWSIWGRIPITVSGAGILIVPEQFVRIQAPASGQIDQILVQLQSTVDRGDAIATVAQPDLQQQLDLARQSLSQLQTQTAQEQALQQKQREQQLAQLDLQSRNLQQQIQAAQSLGPSLQAASLVALDGQQASLDQQLQQQQELVAHLGDSLTVSRQLFSQQLITQDVLLQSEQQYSEALAQVANLQTQLQQLSVQRIQQEQQGREANQNIASLQAQLEDLDVQRAQIELQASQTADTQAQQLSEAQQTVDRLQQQLDEQSSILAPYPGRIVDVDAIPSQILDPGTNIATLARSDVEGKLTSLTYFTIGNGRQVQTGDTLSVTPSTVKRADYGGIFADVVAISETPVTVEEVANLIGSDEVASTLTSGNRFIQIRASLRTDADAPSGFQWSSGRGPDLPLAPGTTTSVQATVDRRAPISFVIPLLRQITGLE